MFDNIKISIFLAYKSIIRGNKGTLFLTIFIMTLAFVNLIFISSIFQGMILAVNEQSINNLYGNVVIEPEKDEPYIKQVKAKQFLINSIPGVLGNSAHYIIGALFSYDEYKDGKDIRSGSWQVKSINVADEKRVTNIHQTLLSGEYLEKNDRDKIILGNEISGGYDAVLEHQSLGGVKVGDDIKIIYSNGIQRKYIVKGIFKTKMPIADMIAFVTEKEMESVLGLHNGASEIIIKTEQTGEEDKYIEELKKIGFIKEDIRAWPEYMGMMMSITESFDMIEFILVTIGLLVAAVTIFIVIFVSVVNRRRQIGILKAIGIEEQTIIFSYVLQALFYAVWGVGLGLGLMFFVIMPYFIKCPLDFPIGYVSLSVTQFDVIISSAGLIISSVVGGFIPSWRGARESILNAIWGS